MTTPNVICRDYVTDGVPSSGAHKPEKPAIRTYLNGQDARIDALESNGIAIGSLVFQTRALIDANLAYDANTGAQVVADPNTAFNGIYQKIGASGSGSWTRIAPLPNDLTDGRRNVKIGANTLAANATGSDSVAIGGSALANYLGSDAVAVGPGALINATGIRNTAIGRSAGSAVTSGTGNVHIGHGAGSLGIGQAVNAIDSVAIGNFAYNTNSYQVAFSDNLETMRLQGFDTIRIKHSTRSLYIGQLAGRQAATGGANIGIGAVALANVTTGDSLVAVGDYAMNAAVTSINSVAFGRDAARYGTGTTDCVHVGNYAGQRSLTGVGDTVVGFRSMQHATQARNNSTLGDSAFWIYQGQGSIALGYRVAEHLESGNNNIIAGVNAANGLRTLSESVLVGFDANALPGVTVTRDETGGTASGSVDGGAGQTGVGFRALLNARSPRNVALGSRAGASLVGVLGTPGNNIFIGPGAGDNASQLTSAVNTVAIGADVFTTADNQFKLGNSSHVVHVDGGRIKFPATQVASSDPNVLDDYEEGSTTPTITSETGSFTTVSGSLFYTKIGNRVVWEAEIIITTAGTAAGRVFLPLPFTASRATVGYGMDTSATLNALAVRVTGAEAQIFSTTGGASPIGSGRTLRVGGSFSV